MAFYTNSTKTSLFSDVEFSPVSQGNFTFFYVRGLENKEAARQWVTSKDVGQTVIAEAMVGGRPVLVTHGDKSIDEIQLLLGARGDKLEFVPPPKKGIDTWKIISMLAVPGQSMQLASAFMAPKVGGKSKVKPDLFAFAASNLLGHVIGWIYGSQKSDDTDRLKFVKKQTTEGLLDYVPADEKLPGLQEDRSFLRDEPSVPPTAAQRTNEFLKRNSVTFGELFLRIFGAFALAFPTDKWGAAWGKLRRLDLKGAYKAGRNSSIVHWSGMGSLLGKFLAMGATTPNPYSSKPHTALDTFREKYLFNIGGNIEAASFGLMSYDAFTNPKNLIVVNGKTRQNLLSGVGASMFAIRYIVRNFAKKGEMVMDMDEVYAHATDSLAKMSPQQMPQLLAETAADLTNHFQDKGIHYGQVFTQLMNDLYRYHQIPLKPFADQAISKTSETGAQAPAKQEAAFTPSQGPRAVMDRVLVPGDRHTENISKANETPLGISA